MASYRIEICPSTTWLDITHYVVINDWGGTVLAEERLGDIQSGSLTFTLVDKHTDKNTHYWIDTITSGGAIPVRVFNADDALLFYGRVEPTLCTYLDDCLTTFTACSLLQYLDKLDVNHEYGRYLLTDLGGTRTGNYRWNIPTANLRTACVCEDDVITIVHGGSIYYNYVKRVISTTELETKEIIEPEAGSTSIRRGLIGRYSGPVGPTVQSHAGSNLAHMLLARIGIPTNADNVFVKTVALGDDQSVSDWTHTRRFWSEPDDDLAGHGISDFVPAPESTRGTGIVGYFLRQGRLYKQVGESGAVECTLPDGSPVTTSGYRLFPYKIGGGRDCLLIVDAKQRHSNTLRLGRWGGATYLDLMLAIGTLIAMQPEMELAKQIYLLVGSTVLRSALYALTTTKRAVSNADTVWAITQLILVDLDENGNIGNLYHRRHNMPNEVFSYCPGDSVAVLHGDGTRDDIVFVCVKRADNPERMFDVRAYTQIGDSNQWELIATTDQLAAPAGGIAVVDDWLCVGALEGVGIKKISDPSTQLSPRHFKQPPHAYIAGLRRAGYIDFIYGNNSTTVMTVNTSTGTIIETNVMELDAGASIVCVNPTPVIYNDREAVPAIAEIPDSSGRRYLYAGLIRVKEDESGVIFDKSICQYPLPQQNIEWRPPVLFYDSNQAIYRLAVLGQSTDNDFLITDLVKSGLYLRPYVHHDFLREPLTLTQTLKGISDSFWVLVRLLDNTAATSEADARIVSRHAWSPTGAAGALTATTLALPICSQGIEYYDGAVANVGVHIEVGDTSVGRSVKTVSGAFLTASWARYMARRIVELYPRRHATKYPHGRRVFTVEAVHYLSGETPVLPDVSLYRRLLSFSGLTGVNISTTVLRVGIAPARGTIPLTLLETYVDPSSGRPDGVDWVADQPDEDVVPLAFPVYEALTEPREYPTGGEIIYPWIIDSSPIEPQSWAEDSPLVIGWRVHLPYGLLLRGYGYGLTVDGQPQHGALFLSVWTDDNGVPGTRYNESLALALHDQRPEGWNLQRLNAQGRFNYCQLPPGVVWVIVCIDKSSTRAVVAPPIDWWEGKYCGTGHALRFTVPFAGYVAQIPPSPDSTRQVPAIYLVGFA